MKLKSIDKTAAVAWSPGNHSPLLALGSAAGTLDPSFNSVTELEIYDSNLNTRNLKLKKLASVPVVSRFNSLTWSIIPNDTARTMGIIAGGLENGEVAIWNSKSIIENKPDAQILKQKAHKGAVKGLDFNNTQPNLLVSASVEGEILIWDLNNLTKPISPGNKSQKLDDITAVAWNRQFAHILASSSINGYTVIWDLKNKREISHLGYPGGRKPITSIAWHPDVPLQIATAADDDYNPAILLWDLRNATAPIQSFNGHAKGVLSLSWCSKDSDLLLSTGKDNRTILWNVPSASPLGDLHVGGNWGFEAKWCHRNPDLSVVASFDGKVTIHSLQGTDEPIQEETLLSPSVVVPDDPFAAAIMQGMNSVPKPQDNQFKLQTPPKWYKRPVGATWGFGGRLVSFNSNPNSAKSVSVRSISNDQLFFNRIQELKNVIYQDDIQGYLSFIEQRIAGLDANSVHEKEVWGFLQFLFGGAQIADALGYKKEDAVGTQDPKLTALIGKLKLTDMKLGEPPKPSPAPGQGRRASTLAGSPEQNHTNGLFADAMTPSELPFDTLSPNIQDAAKIDGAAQQSGPTYLPKFTTPLKLYSSLRVNNEEYDVDALITKSLISGDFETAVKACFASNRLADGLAIAVSGGSELLQNAQREYFIRMGEKKPYSRILQDIVTMDTHDVVERTDLDDDANAWKDVLTFIYTYADPEEAYKLLKVLGERLESLASKSKRTDPSTIKSKRSSQRYGSILSFMGSGDLERVLNLWLSSSEESEDIAASTNSSDPKKCALAYAQFISKLQSTIEKVSIYRKASNFVDQDLYAMEPFETYKLSTLYDQYIEYADCVIDQGAVDFAWYFAQMVPDVYQTKTRTGNVSNVMKHKLYSSGRVDASSVSVIPQIPFEQQEIFDADTYIQQQQQLQQQQYGNQGQNMYGRTAYGNQGYPSTTLPSQPTYDSMYGGQRATGNTVNNHQSYGGYGGTSSIGYNTNTQSSNAYGGSMYNNNNSAYGSASNLFGGPPVSTMAPPPITKPTAPVFAPPPMINPPLKGGMTSAPPPQSNPVMPPPTGSGVWNEQLQRVPTPAMPPPPSGPPMAALQRRRSSASPKTQYPMVPAPVQQPGIYGQAQSSNIPSKGVSPSGMNMIPENPKPIDIKDSISAPLKPTAQQLDKLLKQYDENPNTGLAQKKMLEEAQKRLDVLYKQMAGGNFPKDVCDRLNELIKAMERNDYPVSHKIQLDLMTTRFDVTGQWIVGIKRLIDVAEKAHSLKVVGGASGQPLNGPPTPQGQNLVLSPRRVSTTSSFGGMSMMSGGAPPPMGPPMTNAAPPQQQQYKQLSSIGNVSVGAPAPPPTGKPPVNGYSHPAPSQGSPQQHQTPPTSLTPQSMGSFPPRGPPPTSGPPHMSAPPASNAPPIGGPPQGMMMNQAPLTSSYQPQHQQPQGYGAPPMGGQPQGMMIGQKQQLPPPPMGSGPPPTMSYQPQQAPPPKMNGVPPPPMGMGAYGQQYQQAPPPSMGGYQGYR